MQEYTKHTFAMSQYQSFKGVIYLCACLCAVFFGAPQVQASYTVSPMVIDTKAEARDIIAKDITLVNTGTSPVTLYPSVNEISLKEGGTIEEFKQAVESDRTRSVTSWLEINRLGIDLQPGASKTIPLTIRMSPDPVPNTYHAFIGFGNGGNRDEAERQVKSGDAPGVVVTITIAEEKKEFLKLAKFVVSRFVTSADNQAAVFTFRNPGDETIVPQGEIILFDRTGKEVGALPINTETMSLTPGAEHTFTASVPVDGMFGKYKAFLSVEYGSTQRASLQDTSYFYVFPVKMIVIVLILLALIAGCSAWYVHKKYFDDTVLLDDSERLTVHVRDATSEPKHHDIDLSKTP
jgi:hypothetical protein